MKDSAWLKLLRHSNSLYVRATRAITNHAPIEEYCLRLFSRELFKYLCGLYPIKSRCHILQEYRRYNNYWNPNRKSLKHFVAFWSLIQELSLFVKVSSCILLSIKYCCLLFSSFSFSSLFFSLLLSYLSSYIVATMVYYCILYNKLLIKKKVNLGLSIASIL